MELALTARQYDVVRIIARLNVGGPARHVMHLTERLAESYPTLLVTGTVDAGEADMLEEARARNIAVYQIPELGRAVRATQDVTALRKLVDLLRRVRPRIVHTHTAKAGTLGRMAGLMTRTPRLVHTFHGHVFHGYFSHTVSTGIAAVERTLAYGTDRIVAISEAQAADLTTRYRICRPQRVRVIPLGLELEPFRSADRACERACFRREIGAGEDEPVITIVGRLVPIKNHQLFLDAAQLVLQQRRALFVIAGDGTEAEALKARAAQLGIAERVRFLGWRQDLARVYAGSDVVALTSRNEGTPVCLMEALAGACPVVATNVGGVADVLENGRIGYLAPAGDAVAFAARLRHALEQRAEAEQLARAGQESVLRRYGVERLCRDTMNLYDELTAAPRTRN